MQPEDLPAGWDVWNAEEHRCILAYRPDVFDGDTFPSPCLPTIYLTKGRRSRKPGRERPDPAAAWHVTLYLEPEVSGETQRYDDRERAVAGARDLAARFARGEVDYRGLYQVPREQYFAKLDELTGREDGAPGRET